VHSLYDTVASYEDRPVIRTDLCVPDRRHQRLQPTCAARVRDEDVVRLDHRRPKQQRREEDPILEVAQRNLNGVHP
jgi:hypothetical protein